MFLLLSKQTSKVAQNRNGKRDRMNVYQFSNGLITERLVYVSCLRIEVFENQELSKVELEKIT